MKHPILLLSTLALLPGLTAAQLAPTMDAPLRDHLMEVNKEWRTMDPALVGGERIVHFSDEADRIATHLHLVRERLAERQPEGLSAAQMNARMTLLAYLDRYADRGLFPQNHVLPYRNPVFIDPSGTACAVGQLMIESGSRPLANHISQEMNLAYVHDMQWPEIGAWASDHGFTADELAWIQPSYSPPTIWTALGNGTDGRVTTLLKLANGDLLVAGEFTDAGGVSATHVARWDGTNYQPLGGGVSGTADAAVEFNGMIYLGGSFQGAVSDLAIWNGTSWSYDIASMGMSPRVRDLCVFNNELYAATEGSGFAGWTYAVMMLVGGNWQPVDYSFDLPVHALTVFDGKLVAAGEFTQVLNPNSTIAQYVAVLNGTWQQLADGLDAAVHDLHVMNGDLYAGGEMYHNVAPAFGLARIAPSSSNWEWLMPNLSSYITLGGGPAYISCLTDAGGTIYFGGEFGITTFMSYGSNAGQFLGTPDQVVPLGLFDAAVNAMAALVNRVVLGGDFTSNNFNLVPYIAYTDLNVGVPEMELPQLATPWPNPATSSVTVDATPFRGLPVRVVDATGRVVVAERTISSDRLQLDVSGLAPGAYRVQILGNDVTRSAAFMKH